MNISNNCVVSIDFKLTDDQGVLLDESDEGTPLIYLHGASGVVPGLEKALLGKAVGEAFSVTVLPEEGFGAARPELMQKFALTDFPDPSQLYPGMHLEGTGADSGQVTEFVVKEITAEHVVLDSNHHMAGMTLCFAGTIKDVREATDEEISQGHPL
jgi:FKBP-type peptidyl-prolyl cis-trans isomerase SlyD